MTEPAVDPPPLPLPAGTVLVPADDLRTKDRGRVLIGGAPLSIVRLSDAGAELVKRWFAGQPLTAGPEPAQRLARRLTANGMASPAFSPPGGAWTTSQTELTVIIPVKDDSSGLGRTLHALQDGGTTPTIIVVDDGSTVPVTVADDRVLVMRRKQPGGPGVARQAGLAAVESPTVAFVDAGVVVTTADLARLAGELQADPDLVAVAPRVRSEPGPGIVARYDERRSPLDLGPRPSPVGPGRLVPYVPTACLVVDAAALATAGGFDPDLRYGEDVDLVWRLGDVGSVRYHPEVTVTHAPRPSVAAMVEQRRSYGSAAAPLADRHGSAVAPSRISPWSLAVAALATLGWPAGVVGLGAWTATALRPKLEPLPDVTVEAGLLTARGHWYGGLSLLTAAARTWAPILAAAALVLPGQRRRLAAIAAAAAGRRLLDGPRQLGPAALDIGLGAVDDLAYCAGVWQGAMRARSTAALRPDLISWPDRSTSGEGHEA